MKKTYNDHSINNEQEIASVGIAAVHTRFSSQSNISKQKLRETAQTSQQYSMHGRMVDLET